MLVSGRVYFHILGGSLSTCVFLCVLKEITRISSTPHFSKSEKHRQAIAFSGARTLHAQGQEIEGLNEVHESKSALISLLQIPIIHESPCCRLLEILTTQWQILNINPYIKTVYPRDLPSPNVKGWARGVINHLRNERYLGSMKPFSVSVSQDP